eukprot:538647-Rhodomonas_salina.1
MDLAEQGIATAQSFDEVVWGKNGFEPWWVFRVLRGREEEAGWGPRLERDALRTAGGAEEQRSGGAEERRSGAEARRRGIAGGAGGAGGAGEEVRKRESIMA